MISLFSLALVAIVAASFGAHFLFRLRSLRAVQASADTTEVGRYRPMLRLLSESDLAFVSSNRERRSLRSERHRLFRHYLKGLGRDYGRLLARLRLVMVQSGVDRPDLAKAISHNRTVFALAMCRVELRLALHAAGIGTVEISGLVEALDILRTQVAALSAPLAQSMSPA